MKADRDGRGVIVLADSRRITVGHSETVSIPPGAKNQKGEASRISAGLWKALAAKFQTTFGSETYHPPAPPAVRDGSPRKSENLLLIHPRKFEDPDGQMVRSRVISDSAILLWTAVGSATSYSVHVFEGKQAIRAESLSAEQATKEFGRHGIACVRLSAGFLHAGSTYAWEVEAATPNGVKRSERTEFGVLSVERAVEARKNQILAHAPEDNVARLLNAALYESEGLLANAVTEYLHAIAREPSQPAYHRLLGKLYELSEIYALASEEYRIGLETLEKKAR